MDLFSKHRYSKLLRYTYRANLVFFAGFAGWYVMRGQQQEEELRQVRDKTVEERK
ncbi:hypothetical protein K458DRAFT_423206 [Lentithecium fluviatile CBS 122367]|uniref:Uncharacterized protein n=1 Tax=Lentithecium fluviatile CBS 122367 TaxID=1168545 RepID=A0A6G1IK46_9PLEO|nr:hypothetical protein K458DRAFT_423206 [Lentithecium fluviatile CBS 122367]